MTMYIQTCFLGTTFSMFELFYQSWSSNCYEWRRNISSRFSRNSEAFASETTTTWNNMYNDVCTNLQTHFSVLLQMTMESRYWRVACFFDFQDGHIDMFLSSYMSIHMSNSVVFPSHTLCICRLTHGSHVFILWELRSGSHMWCYNSE